MKKLFFQAKRILVICLNEIGDFVLLTAFLRELRSNVPRTSITLLVKPELENLARPCPYIDTLYTYNLKAGGILAKPKLYIRKLWIVKCYLQGKYDMVIVPRWHCDMLCAASLAQATRAPCRVGYADRNKRSDEGYNQYFTYLIEDRSIRHEVERNLNILRFLNGKVENKSLELWLTRQDRGQAQQVLSSFTKNNSPLIALGIGASKKHKKWPIKHFIALCQEILQKKAVQFLIIGDARDYLLAEEMHAVLGGNLLNLAGKLSLRESAAVLEKSVLFIGNDSGPKHMAAALKTRVIEISCHPLEGGDDSEMHPSCFGPWREGHMILRPQVLRKPCSGRCLSHEAHCILGVKVEDVVTKALHCIP